MFMAEVAAQKAPDGYETMDVDFVPVSESPVVQANQRFNMAILKEDRKAEAQLDAERAHAAAIEALLQAEAHARPNAASRSSPPARLR